MISGIFSAERSAAIGRDLPIPLTQLLLIPKALSWLVEGEIAPTNSRILLTKSCQEHLQNVDQGLYEVLDK